MIGTIGKFKAAIGAAWSFLKAHQKAIFRSIVAVVFAALCVTAVLTVQKSQGYEQIKKENEGLQTALVEKEKEVQNVAQSLKDTEQKMGEVQARLEYEQQQVTLYKESTNALTQQVSELNAIKEDLNNKLEELLRVEEAIPVITRNELEAQISALSELVTLKYIYRNATRQESSKTWLWGWTMPMSDSSLLATYDGTITAGIDLKDVKFDVDNNTRTITVTIPESRIFDHNIPQETINVLEVKNNLFNSITFNDYNKFISAEKLEMELVAINQGLLRDARTEAREVLKAFLNALPGMDSYTLKFN